jgi:hypothetical protein
MSTAVGTLESLRETLKQTMEEKAKFETKVVEDRTRLEARIAELKKVVSDYTAELQSIHNTLQTMQPDTASENLKRPKLGYEQLQTPSLVADEKAKNWFDSPIAWFVGVVAMFILLWVIMSAFEKPKADACAMTSRIQERRVEVCKPVAEVEKTESVEIVRKITPRRPVRGVFRALIRRAP